MAIISRPSIPEVVFERVKTDLTEFAFNFFQDGITLDVSARTYKVRLKTSGVNALDKASATNAAGRVTFTLTDAEKTNLNSSEYQFFLVEILAGGGEKTLMAGTLRWSVPFGKPTGLVSAPDVSVNYITATQELMVALGVVDFGSMSSAVSAAQAEAAKLEAIDAQNLTIELKNEVEQLHDNVADDADLVATTAIQVQQAKTGVDAGLVTIQQLIAQGFNVKGNWNIPTNTPNLTSITKANGDAYVVKGPGTTTITGQSITAVDGDVFHWNQVESKWIYRANATVPADNSVSPEKLVAWLKSLFGQLPDDSPYLDLKVDSAGRKLWAIRRSDGFIEGRFQIEEISMMPGSVNTASVKADAIDYTKLAQAVRDLMFKNFDNTDSQWFRFLIDTDYRIINGEKKDGTTFIAKPEFTNRSIKKEWIEQAVQDLIPTAGFNRLNAYNPNVVDHVDDGFMRGNEIDIPATTDISGYGFAAFPPVNTPYLSYLNSSGVALQFRKTKGLTIRGKRYRGTFNPTASGVVGTNLRGNYGNSSTNSYPAFPAGSTGDCWVCDAGTGTGTVTANGLTFKSGDLLVKTASSYDIQPGPPVSDGLGAMQDGDFWDVTTSGQFGNLTLSNTGRLVLAGYMSQSGPRYARYIASKKGEYFLRGECSTGFVLPASPRYGDMYNFSGAATISSLAGVEGDSLIYTTGWGLLKGEMVQVEPGGLFVTDCRDAKQWAFRKAAKTTAKLSITASGYWGTVSRQVSDSLILRSDSMFGGSTGTGGKILTLTGRTGAVTSYGGGTSLDVLNMIKHDIRNGDPYAGWINIVWHGQNNWTDVAQTKQVAYEVAALTGARNERLVFWSVLGQRVASFTGGRIVLTTQEDAKAGTNAIAQTEQFYANTFPKQWFCPRTALLETAIGRTMPDPQFPGMTEEQVAATYGGVPFSYFFDFTGKPFTQADLTQARFLGYYSSAGLPTGGTDKNYYVRTGNGTVGQLIVNNAGTWVEYAHDVTHPNATGQDALAGKFKDFLTLINI